ncbi:Response regulator PleD [Maioricimonas rarisocia]|uniref:histidine kinase n=1 Tax=Maioricimonas rarisocia TaxID=2528026 RepID=A0A517Z856_9PLAN|nr:response regulator [Maioricimonas rarisocia]QDU38664.1 Response regulator PleD [Maioricimonas rarisocia]
MTDAGSTSSDRILIADDNQQNRELLEAYLADDGHDIFMATDGVETIDMAVSEQPDLILLDIMMPKLSGYEVCQQLKQDERTRDIPVLMVTALKEMGDIERAVAAGADDFLTKPVHRIELKTRVRSLLRVRHLTNERDRLLAYLAEVEQPPASRRSGTP